jgi:hypothetical protein
MKKHIVLLLLIMGVAFSVPAIAQESYPVFSPSIFIGGKTIKDQKRIPTSNNTPTNKYTKYRRIALKYYEGQREPTDAQKEELLKVVARVHAGQVSEINLQAFSSKRWDSYLRIHLLSLFFKNYVPDTLVKGFVAEEESVLKKNDNMVYLTEIP